MATPASDVYSAGVVAFEMLTGELPFPAETPVGVAMRHVNDAPPRPSRIAPGVPREVDAIVLRALAKDPTRRWPTVGAFARALRSWRDSAAAAPAPRTAPPRPVVAESRGSLVPTVIVVLLVAGALAALLWTGFRTIANGVPPRPTPLSDVPAITGALETPTANEPAPVIVIEEGPGPTPTLIVTQEPVETPPTPPPTAVVAPTIAPAVQASVIVPDLQGLTIAETTRALLPLDLRIALNQPVFSDTIPMNSVAAQDPPPGTSVAPGGVVRVCLSRGRSPFGAGQPLWTMDRSDPGASC
jgi:serine/threonine-protein kinase